MKQSDQRMFLLRPGAIVVVLVALAFATAGQIQFAVAEPSTDCDKAGSEECKQGETIVRDHRREATNECAEGKRRVRISERVNGKRVTKWVCRNKRPEREDTAARADAADVEGGRDIEDAPKVSAEGPSGDRQEEEEEEDGPDYDGGAAQSQSAADDENVCCFEAYGPTEYATRAVCRKRKGEVVAKDRCERGDVAERSDAASIAGGRDIGDVPQLSTDGPAGQPACDESDDTEGCGDREQECTDADDGAGSCVTNPDI